MLLLLDKIYLLGPFHLLDPRRHPQSLLIHLLLTRRPRSLLTLHPQILLQRRNRATPGLLPRVPQPLLALPRIQIRVRPLLIHQPSRSHLRLPLLLHLRLQSRHLRPRSLLLVLLNHLPWFQVRLQLLLHLRLRLLLHQVSRIPLRRLPRSRSLLSFLLILHPWCPVRLRLMRLCKLFGVLGFLCTVD